ncbi:MAG: hypothetical protein PHS07_00660 [Patescibacteria group bacterium]|nr:hypothetical protein [Patescibacteria group bacterium]
MPTKLTPEQKQEQETDIQQVVNHYFMSKGLSLEKIKQDARQKKIIYSRHVRPAKELIALAGSINQAKQAITKVAAWAKSRNLDYSIETVFKKWLELDQLKPKERVKKPFYDGYPLVWSQTKLKWFVIMPDGDWKEFAGKEEEIEWQLDK